MALKINIFRIKKEREDLYRLKNAKIVKSRLPLIKKLIKNKTVLDVGSVQHSSLYEVHPNFLFKFLIRHAKSVTGIDKAKNEVNKLRKKGYRNIIVGDAESVKFKQKFDVITACNIIEHLSNPGLFLKNMKTHLKPEGIIIITTANDGGFISFFHTLFLGYIPENPDHTVGFNYSRLRELVKREELKINKFYYYTFEDIPHIFFPSFILRAYSFLNKMLLRLAILFRKNFAPGCILILSNKKQKE